MIRGKGIKQKTLAFKTLNIKQKLLCGVVIRRTHTSSSSDESSSFHAVLAVSQMLCFDLVTLLTDIVSVVTDDFLLGGWDLSNGCAVQWVSEDQDYRIRISQSRSLSEAKWRVSSTYLS